MYLLKIFEAGDSTNVFIINYWTCMGTLTVRWFAIQYFRHIHTVVTEILGHKKTLLLMILK